jgi:hypothetical protein
MSSGHLTRLVAEPMDGEAGTPRQGWLQATKQKNLLQNQFQISE